MANLASAKKAQKQADRRRVFNLERAHALKSGIKAVKKFVTAKDKAGAEGALPAAYKAIDKAAKRGLIKKNTAARKKSRLTKDIVKMGK